ncbi:SDR family NAD(P)-dependent oxidoreductase, partial [Lipingzhangella sp. LS1_29]
ATQEPQIPFYSSLTGARVQDALDGEYWYRNLRHPVRLAEAVQALSAAGYRQFLEVSPHPVLTTAVQDTIGTDTHRVSGTLRRDRGDSVQMLTALSDAYVHGAEVDWEAVFRTLTPHAVADAQLRAEVADELPRYPFEQTRYWLDGSSTVHDPQSLGLESAAHPVLGASVDLPDGATVLTGSLSPARQGWLLEHTLGASPVVPGTALLDMALHAGRQVGYRHLAELTLVTPLVLPGVDTDKALMLRVVVTSVDSQGHRGLTVHTRANGSQTWTLHATGTLAPGGDTSHEDGSATVENCVGAAGAAWPPAHSRAVDVRAGYDRLEQRGHGYGPVFRALNAAWHSDTEVYAEVDLGADPTPGGFAAHPIVVDAALHALLMSRSSSDSPVEIGAESEPALLPFSWQGVRLHGTVDRRLWVRIQRVARGQQDGLVVGVSAVDQAGTSVLDVAELTLRPATAEWLPTSGEPDLHYLQWVPAPHIRTAAHGHVPHAWVALGEGLPPSIQTEMWCADVSAVARYCAGADRGPVATVTALGSVQQHDGPHRGMEHQALARTHQLLELVQAWLSEPALENSTLVVLTRGALAGTTTARVCGLEDSAAVGLLRSAQTEYPGRFVLVDLDPQDAEPTTDLVAAALATGASQVMVRDGGVYLPQLTTSVTPPPLTPPEGAEAWRLEIAEPGTLERLSLATVEQRPLEAGQVRLEVRAAGVNFRDVLIALGEYPEPAPLGAEVAGIVVETGPGVADLRPGDAVFGLAEGAVGTVAVADHHRVAPIPTGCGFSTAAALPVVFLTAYACLVEVARVQPGERVLVHAAAGGVGLAAIQIAHHLGAEVFATAHPRKWPMLRQLGIPQSRISSSRDTDFARCFRGERGEAVLDVVLNSVTGEAIDAGLELLRPGGRFVELGRSDIRDVDEVGARYPDVRYLPFNLLHTPAADVHRLLGELVRLYEDGVVQPPPVSVQDVRRAEESLRTLRESEHIGKLALTVPRPLDPRGTVLVTGGTGALGARIARHLVQRHGVANVLLVSRRGTEAPGATQLHHELTELGATVTIAAADLSVASQVAQVIELVPEEHPLTGIVHAAGLLEDATVATLTAQQLDTVLRAKIAPALHLHRLTQEHDVSAFVMFSSVQATLGGPGQAAYAAANAFLDAFAQDLRARGTAATSLAWGVWAEESGMTGHLNQRDHERLRRDGVVALSTPEALELFDQGLWSSYPFVVAAQLAPGGQGPLAKLRPRHEESAVSPQTPVSAETPQGDGTPASRRERLVAMSPGEQHRFVTDLVRNHTAQVLGHASPGSIRLDRPFRDMGFDSLTAVELRNRLGAALGLRLPATLTFDHPTPAAVRELILSQLLGDDAPPKTRDQHAGNPGTGTPAGPTPQPHTSTAADIDAMDAADLVSLALNGTQSTDASNRGE